MEVAVNAIPPSLSLFLSLRIFMSLSFASDSLQTTNVCIPLLSLYNYYY